MNSALIVDDESSARENLYHLLERYDYLTQILMASNADEALKIIQIKNPDIIFLDIDMPGKSGIELIRDLRNLKVNSPIIFITAFNQYAIEAIKCAAFDYILKPVDKQILDETMARLKLVAKEQEPVMDKIDKLLDHFDSGKLKITTKRGMQIIKTDEIAYAVSHSNYTEIFMNDQSSHLITKTLLNVQEMLPDCLFIRVGRSCIINKNQLISTDRIKKHITILVGDQTVNISLPVKRIRELERVV